MICQQSWVQFLLGTAIAAFLVPHHPADANSWHSNNNNNNPWIDKALKSHGITADIALRRHDYSNRLEYPIFGGKSALRSLSDSCQTMIRRELCNGDNNDDKKHQKAKVALLLLLAGHGDAAHDVLLGTTLDNLEQAEYAATHRGQNIKSNWAQEHPLSDLEDVLHSLIHRIYEGSWHGEGGYSGYENAQYWCAGGPKQYKQPINSMAANNKKEATSTSTALVAKVYQELCQVALEKTPICVSRGIVAQDPPSPSPPEEAAAAAAASPRTHEKQRLNEKKKKRGGGVTHCIIAGGGKFRGVFVPNKCWDPIAFCELLLLVQHENYATTNHQYDLQQELDYLTEKELELLAKHLLLS